MARDADGGGRWAATGRGRIGSWLSIWPMAALAVGTLAATAYLGDEGDGRSEHSARRTLRLGPANAVQSVFFGLRGGGSARSGRTARSPSGTWTAGWCSRCRRPGRRRAIAPRSAPTAGCWPPGATAGRSPSTIPGPGRSTRWSTPTGRRRPPTAWPSRPTPAPWRSASGAAGSRSGTSPRVGDGRSCPAIERSSAPCPTPPTAAPWPPRAATGPSGSGTSTPPGRAGRSPASTACSSPWPSPPTAAPWRRPTARAASSARSTRPTAPRARPPQRYDHSVAGDQPRRPHPGRRRLARHRPVVGPRHRPARPGHPGPSRRPDPRLHPRRPHPRHRRLRRHRPALGLATDLRAARLTPSPRLPRPPGDPRHCDRSP